MPNILPRAEYLDPRPASEADSAPISRAVNIPATELARRRDELPSKHVPVAVCEGVSGWEEAEHWLNSNGWEARCASGWTPGHRDEPLGRLWAPNELLESWLSSARATGVALDLGCGGGREAVFLAANGWRVLAVDRLNENLHRGSQLAERYLESKASQRITWEKQDVLGAWRPPGRYDLILSFFLFDPGLLAGTAGRLAEGGTLLLEAFTPARRRTHGKPSSPDRVFDPASANEVLNGLEVVQLEQVDGSVGQTARVIARRSH